MNGLEWALIGANLLVLGFGLAITAVSYSAYRASGRDPAFRNSTLGFLLITVGNVLAPIYELGIEEDYLITGNELLALGILEGVVIAVGLALLVLSVYANSQTSKQFRDDPDVSAGMRGD